MTWSNLPETQRAAMNGLYRVLRQATQAPPGHGVPPVCVKAYVAAIYARQHPAEAVSSAYFGIGVGGLGSGGLAYVTAWTEALSKAHSAAGAAPAVAA